MSLEFLLTPQGALCIAAGTTFLAWLESAELPWSPFLILYAIVLPLPPLLAKTFHFGSISDTFRMHAWGIGILSASILAWEIGIMGLLYERVLLNRIGKSSSPHWSATAAMDALLSATAERRRLPWKAVLAWYGFYFIAWAPLAEELFFWGYLYPVLRESNPAVTAAFIVAAFFGIRHALHFLFLPGPFPWPAAASLMASTAGAAFLNGCLYESTQSLWPLIALHLASNLISLATAPPAPATAPLIAPAITSA